VAVKKKAPVKKKTAAKKVVKKVVKKTAKKAPAKKKAAAKKITKKAPARKKAVAKKAPAKKKAVAKKVAKKAPARKKVAKKSAAKKSTSASKIVIPPVPLGGSSSSRVNVTTTPTPVKAAAAKPSAAPKQGTSPRVLIAAILGIALLAVIVISRPASNNDDAAPVATPAATESAAPEMSEAATPAASESAATEAVAAVEAPSRFIGNWKDAAKSVMVITWKAPTATAGLTGYKFEVRSGMGEWKESGMLPATQLSVELTKGSADGSTSFRVSSVYSDGQMAAAKAFGFAGQFA
jgi:hypothetical protein